MEIVPFCSLLGTETNFMRLLVTTHRPSIHLTTEKPSHWLSLRYQEGFSSDSEAGALPGSDYMIFDDRLRVTTISTLTHDLSDAIRTEEPGKDVWKLLTLDLLGFWWITGCLKPKLKKKNVAVAYRKRTVWIVCPLAALCSHWLTSQKDCGSVRLSSGRCRPR